MDAPIRRLAIADATPLAHAYAHAVAASVGVRMLSIKGPAAEYHEVRGPHVSADADLLIDPAGFGVVVERLRAAGWRERPPMAGTEDWSEHSITLIRDGWPCDLDLHDRFPGFLEPAGDVFEALWRDRLPIEVAGRSVDIPSRDGTILIAALHALRRWPGFARGGEELAELHTRFGGGSLTADERASLDALARETGCIESLDGALRDLGVTDAAGSRGDDPALRAWRTRVTAGGTGTHFWLRRLERLPWRERPRELAYIIWPDEENLRRSHPAIAPGRRALNRARVARLGRGARHLPAAVWARVVTRWRR